MKRSVELMTWLRMANAYSPLIPGREKRLHLPLLIKKAVLEGKGAGKAIYVAQCPAAAQLGTRGFIFHKGRDIKATDSKDIPLEDTGVENWDTLTRPELAWVIKEIRKENFLIPNDGSPIEPPKDEDPGEGNDKEDNEPDTPLEPGTPPEPDEDETPEVVTADAPVKQSEESVEEPADPQEEPADEADTELEIPDFTKMSKKEIDEWGNAHAGIDLDGRKSKATMIEELMEHLNK